MADEMAERLAARKVCNEVVQKGVSKVEELAAKRVVGVVDS